MRILILGGGGREHALGWKIAQSPDCEALFFAPGNPGTASLGTNTALSGNDAITAFARENQIDLVVVGPEQPLVDGIADALEASGILCFGPSAAAARLEGSKSFAKEIMVETGIPTAAHGTFSDIDEALVFARQQRHPLVVKADGLAAGKGVTICKTLDETERALREAMQDGRFGEAGETVVLEEFLEGVEASVHMISDGTRFLPLITAKDHKAIGDGDVGPNTGGMGTYAPSPLLDENQVGVIHTTICRPVMHAMASRGTPFRGVLFTGLMLTEDGPKVLEFNVRFGDPETQVMMPMLDFDLLPVLEGAAEGKIPEGDYPFKPGAAVCVVLAASGYPGSARKGDTITGLPEEGRQQVVFHAGTNRDGDHLVTGGGRVLGATAWSDDLASAREKAYEMADQIRFEGQQLRRDIGV